LPNGYVLTILSRSFAVLPFGNDQNYITPQALVHNEFDVDPLVQRASVWVIVWSVRVSGAVAGRYHDKPQGNVFARRQVPDDVWHNSFFAAEQSAVDIGPELPQDECRSVQADVCQPALASLRPGALLFGIVKIGDT
jgi:hypothetical protein